MRQAKFPLQKIFLFALLFLGMPFTHSQTLGIFEEQRPLRRVALTQSSPRIDIELDYTKAFDVVIQSNIGNQICSAWPSSINYRMDWTGPFPASELPYSYDNILTYKDYVFMLDSISFTILVAKDLKDPTSYLTVPSGFVNQVDENEQFDEPFMVLDEENGFVYIITNTNIFSYDLRLFLADPEDAQPIKPMNTTSLEPFYEGYDSILNVVHDKDTLYIAADNIIEVYSTDNKGNLKTNIKFDEKFFGVTEIGIVDIEVQGNYAYILDKIHGLFVVRITKAKDQIAFTFLDDLREIKISKAQFVEVIGNSLSIISTSSKVPFIQEYIIRDTAGKLKLFPNRKVEMFQAVRDTYGDANFLYVLTGFYNLVVKHSIPGRYSSENVDMYLQEYWPLYGAKAMVSTRTDNSISKIVAIQDDMITMYTLREMNPVLSCSAEGVEPGTYYFQMKATQATCPVKESNGGTASWDSVCVIQQTIELLVAGSGERIGNVTASQKHVNYLMLSAGLMLALFFMFLYMCYKERRQYRMLEDKIKFQKIESESSEQTGQRRENPSRGESKAQSEIEIHPDMINIQAELEKAEKEERDKKKAHEKETPNADFGDIKPLDIDAIYGNTKKKKDDDDDDTL